jgi:hypothetical protein
LCQTWENAPRAYTWNPVSGFGLRIHHPRRPIHAFTPLPPGYARAGSETGTIADGYHDTGIVLRNMRRHFLKDELVDTKFEADHPELLVYTSDWTNLLAIEYAGPLSATPPEGFQGDADQWVPFGGVFWTLHAWVWKDNPDGLFNPTNSRVQ